MYSSMCPSLCPSLCLSLCLCIMQALWPLVRATFARREPIRMAQVSHGRDILNLACILQTDMPGMACHTCLFLQSDIQGNVVACNFLKRLTAINPTPNTLRFRRSHAVHPLRGRNILDRNRSV